jgi:RNA polymerase II-associated protein 3
MNLERMKSMSIDDGDNKASEEQNDVDKRKQEAVEFKDKGNKFVKNKDYESAIKMYSKAIELFSEDPIFYSNRSQCFLSLEKYKECIEDASRAIMLDPKSSKSYYRRMVAYEKLGDDFKALQNCRKLLDLTPDDTASKSSYDRIHNRLAEAEKKKDKEKIRWSRLGKSSKVIEFVSKSPHLCSKRPMNKISVRNRKPVDPIPESVIDRIFDNNTGEHVPEPETDSKLFKPNFLTSPTSEQAPKPRYVRTPKPVNPTPNDIVDSIYNNKNTSEQAPEHETSSPPKTAKVEEKPEKAEIVDKKKLDETNEMLKVATEVKKETMLTLEELEAQKNHMISTPLNSLQFYTTWRGLNEPHRFLYLKHIVDNCILSFTKLLGAQLDSEMLSEIIHVIHKYFIQYNLPAITLLSCLSKNSEIVVLSMFLESDEKRSKLPKMICKIFL